MEKYKVSFVETNKPLSEKDLQEIRNIMTDIIARYIVKNKKK